jgi:hypothetical protein
MFLWAPCSKHLYLCYLLAERLQCLHPSDKFSDLYSGNTQLSGDICCGFLSPPNFYQSRRRHISDYSNLPEIVNVLEINNICMKNLKNYYPLNYVMHLITLVTAVAQWLRFCATNLRVTGSIPDGVIGIFRWHNPPYLTMALGSTQKWVFRGGKGGRCVRLTTLPPFCAVVKKCGNLNFLEPSGPLQACNGTALP